MNLTIIKGRLTTAPELKQTPSGVSVATFSVAVDRDYTPKGEEKQTDFFNVVAWRGTADFVSKYFDKGQEILINGAMQCRNYTDKDGNKRYVWELVASNLHFCGSKAQNTQQDTQQPTTDTDGFTPVEIDGDLPF